MSLERRTPLKRGEPTKRKAQRSSKPLARGEAPARRPPPCPKCEGIRAEIVAALRAAELAAEERATDDAFHDSMLMIAHVEAGLADEYLKAVPDEDDAGDEDDGEEEEGSDDKREAVILVGATVRALRRAQKALAEMRGLACPECREPPLAECRGGGLFSFECKCGKTPSDSTPRRSHQGTPSTQEPKA